MCGSLQRTIVVNESVLVCACVEAVSANSEKIRAEELQCKAMAENAQRDLDEALPALEEAMKVDLCPVRTLPVPLCAEDLVCTPGALFVHYYDRLI